MLTVAEALDAVLEHARALPAASASRLLEARWVACWRKTSPPTLDSPPFDKALVDGYAVRSRRP